jgi:hypothetical protein
MSRAAQRYREREIGRVVRGVKKAGVEIDHVVAEDGRISVYSKPAGSAQAVPNPWDGVLKDAEKRST